MSFKFEFKIDYEKLTNLLDSFLKSHSDELTAIMGQCLVLQPSSTTAAESPPSSTEKTTTVVSAATNIDYKIDNRPLIGDSIPEDPFKNLFTNPNSTTTRYQDRNEPKNI